MIAIWASCPLDALSERKEIEDAVILRLAGLLKENGGFLLALEPWNGEIGEGDVDDYYRELQGRSPAILVATSAGRYRRTSVSAKETMHEVTLDMLMVSNTLSGHAQRTRGDGQLAEDETPTGFDPGIYHLLAATRKLIMGRALGIGRAGRPRPVTEQQVFAIQGLSAWRAVYRVPVRIVQTPINEAELGEAEIRELQANHYNRDEVTDYAALVASAITSAGGG